MVELGCENRGYFFPPCAGFSCLRFTVRTTLTRTIRTVCTLVLNPNFPEYFGTEWWCGNCSLKLSPAARLNNATADLSPHFSPDDYNKTCNLQLYGVKPQAPSDRRFLFAPWLRAGARLCPTGLLRMSPRLSAEAVRTRTYGRG